MVFGSTVFLFLFLPVVLALYLVTPRRIRNLWLLCVSLFFYAWGETFLVSILLISTGIDYVCGLIIAGAYGENWKAPIEVLKPGGERTRLQRAALIASIVSNVTILGVFKYFNFGLHNFNALMSALHLSSLRIDTAARIALPMGVSFFTFQSMSYTSDVYLGNVRATRNFLNFATFVSLFPQLVAGPIVRYLDIAEELIERRVSRERFALGIRRFIVGLGKKLLIANTAAVGADQIFGLPTGQLTAGVAWVGVICYTLQIYFDFSGYSDMAIGLGHLFGFTFRENFSYPYVSRSITEFWRRWHMTLSFWFRDYLYIPLGGNRKGRARTYFNLCLTFLLCGLWHGAAWNFVAWGLFHGFFLVVERVTAKRVRFSLWTPLRHVYVTTVTMFSWVLFRAEGLHHAVEFLKAMAGMGQGMGEVYYASMYLNNELLLAIGLGAIGSMPVIPWFTKGLSEFGRRREGIVGALLDAGQSFAGLAALALIFYLSALQLSAATHNPFIYFRF